MDRSTTGTQKGSLLRVPDTPGVKARLNGKLWASSGQALGKLCLTLQSERVVSHLSLTSRPLLAHGTLIGCLHDGIRYEETSLVF